MLTEGTETMATRRPSRVVTPALQSADEELLNKGLGAVEESDDAFPKSFDIKFNLACLPPIVILIGGLFVANLIWASTFTGLDWLYPSGPSYMGFQRAVLLVVNATNTSTYSRSHLPVQNNGDKFVLQNVFSGLVWSNVAVDFIALVWAYVIYRFYKVDDNFVAWGVNHFSLFFRRVFFYMVAIPIVLHLMNYPTILSIGYGMIYAMLIEITGILLSSYNQYHAEFPKEAEKNRNGIFTLFSVVSLLASIAILLAFPFIMFVANHENQTTLTRNGTGYTVIYEMFVVLMFDICFNLACCLYKLICVVLGLTGYNMLAGKKKGNNEKLYYTLTSGPFKFKVVVEILEHVSVTICQIIFICKYMEGFRTVNFPAVS